MRTFTTSMRVESKLYHRHNVDARYRATLSHIDGTRTRENEVLVDEMMGKNALTLPLIGDLFRRHEFANGKNVLDLIDEYNEGKKPSRQTSVEKEFKKHTGDFHRQIREQEMIIQVGDRDTVNNAYSLGGDRISINREEAKEVLINAFNDFMERYGDRVIITQVALHMDEMTPHLHIDYIPCVLQEDKKQGIKCSFSQDVFAKSTLSARQLEEAREEAERSNARNKEKEFNKNCYRAYQKNIADLISERAREKGIEIKNPEIRGAKHNDKAYLYNRLNELEKSENRLNSTQKELNQTRQENNQLKQEREKNQGKLEITDRFYKACRIESEEQFRDKLNQLITTSNNLKRQEKNGQSVEKLQDQIERLCRDVGYEMAERYQGNKEQISRAEGRLINNPSHMTPFMEGVKEWQEQQHERNRYR